MDGLSLLERLPRELVWMIIDYTPESFFQLGEVRSNNCFSSNTVLQTSKMLRSHMHAYSLEPVKIKLVKQITFDFFVLNFGKLYGIDSLFQNENVVVLMRENTTKLFQLRLKLRSPNLGDTEFYRGMRAGNNVSYRQKCFLIIKIIKFFSDVSSPIRSISHWKLSPIANEMYGKKHWCSQDISVGRSRRNRLQSSAWNTVYKTEIWWQQGY